MKQINTKSLKHNSIACVQQSVATTNGAPVNRANFFSNLDTDVSMKYLISGLQHA